MLLPLMCDALQATLQGPAQLQRRLTQHGLAGIELVPAGLLAGHHASGHRHAPLGCWVLSKATVTGRHAVAWAVSEFYVYE